MKSNKNKTNRYLKIKLITFLAATCLFLSTVEYAIPKPLPFLRLGLANIPLIISLAFLPVNQVFLLAALKIIGQAFVSGTLFSYVFIFSAGGTMASTVAMILLFSIKKRNPYSISFVGISLFGSLANNLVQILLARFIMFGENALYIAPVLLISGLATGLITGVFTNYFCDKSHWYSIVLTELKNDTIIISDDLSKSENSSNGRKELYWFVAGILSFFVFVFQKSLIVISIMTLCFICILAVRRKIEKKGKLKLGIPFCVFSSVVFFSLLSPMGKVLFSFWKIVITQGALESGIRRGLVLCGTVFLSQLMISKDMQIPGNAGKMVAGIFRYVSLLTMNRDKNEKKIETQKSKHEFARKHLFSNRLYIEKFFEKIDERLIFTWNNQERQGWL